MVSGPVFENLPDKYLSTLADHQNQLKYRKKTKSK